VGTQKLNHESQCDLSWTINLVSTALSGVWIYGRRGWGDGGGRLGELRRDGGIEWRLRGRGGVPQWWGIVSIRGGGQWQF